MDRPDSFLADSDVEPTREPTMQKPRKRTTSSPSHPLVFTLACGSRKAPKAFECLLKSDRVWSIKSLEGQRLVYDRLEKERTRRSLVAIESVRFFRGTNGGLSGEQWATGMQSQRWQDSGTETRGH